LIEAGVDVDFPVVLREMAPLESIVQAAGRCNREGRIPNPGGMVRVFRSAEGRMPPDRWYNAGRDKVEQILRAQGDGPRVDDPAAIRDYFDRLYYSGELDAAALRRLRETFKFRSLAESYRLIDDAGQPVVVATWASRQAVIASLLAELADRPRRGAFRQLAPFQVNLLPSQRLKSQHLFHENPTGLLVWDGRYDEDVGIVEEMVDDFIV
jgi:CRISPR-associated endonuclease/helicase Cas3